MFAISNECHAVVSKQLKRKSNEPTCSWMKHHKIIFISTFGDSNFEFHSGKSASENIQRGITWSVVWRALNHNSITFPINFACSKTFQMDWNDFCHWCRFIAAGSYFELFLAHEYMYARVEWKQNKTTTPNLFLMFISRTELSGHWLCKSSRWLSPAPVENVLFAVTDCNQPVDFGHFSVSFGGVQCAYARTSPIGFKSDCQSFFSHTGHSPQ